MINCQPADTLSFPLPRNFQTYFFTKLYEAYQAAIPHNLKRHWRKFRQMAQIDSRGLYSN